MALLVLARFTLHPVDGPTAVGHYRELEPLLRAVPGFRGQMLGKDAKGSGRHVAVSRYENLAAAERGLVAVAQHPLNGKLMVTDGATADVARYAVQAEGHGGVFRAGVGQFVSLTVRTAEPGNAEKLADDLDIIFGELAVIPGFLGHTVGFHESLPEQACALAAWTRPGAFEMSLPEGRIHDVELYERVV